MPPDMRVLHIEDDPADRRLVEETLREASGSTFTMESSSRLADGLKKLASGKFDVVLLDLSLPDSQGLATFTRARAAAPVPIVVLTGLDDEELGIQAVRAGAEDYLSKAGIAPATLSHAIRYAIERHQRRPAKPRVLGQVVAVAGPKGGVGKTMLAINIAATLAQGSDLHVTIVDLDLQFGDLELLLNLPGERSVMDFVRLCPENPDGEPGAPFDDAQWAVLLQRAFDGIQLLKSPGDPTLAGLVKGRHITRLLDELLQRSGWVVIDTPSHADEAVLQALQEADRIVLVTDPFLPSLKDVEIFLKVLHGLKVPQEKILLVLNRAGAEAGMLPREIEARLHFPISMVLPNEPLLAAHTTQDRVSLTKAAPHSVLYARIRELTAQIRGESTEVRKTAA